MGRNVSEIPYDRIARQRAITVSDVRAIWHEAARFDKSLKLKTGVTEALLNKRVQPSLFSRGKLFESMVGIEPSLFCRVPVRSRVLPAGQQFSIVDEIRRGLPKSRRARVRTSESVNYTLIREVIDRWTKRDESIFSVTDLHYCGTRFDRRIDTNALNDFNLLRRGTDGFQSQDSLVISSMGAVTDSHSDDHSGSNHSFVGAKLWLLWDTLEGLKYGLEDVERCTVYERAAFDLAAFLRMRSSRWILIGSGQTMFVPAHLTHKVITLSPYFGLGSFHAALPGFCSLLNRWAVLPPLWASRRANSASSVESLTRRAIGKIEKLKNANRRERYQWGMSYLRASLERIDIFNATICDGSTSSCAENLKRFVGAARQAI